MAQTLPRFCPRCGTPTVAGQRFCRTCGLKTEDMWAQAGSGYSRPPTLSQDLSLSPTVALPPPTPPLVEPPQAQDVQTAPPPFKPPGQKRRLGRVGWISIILLLLIVLGAGGYFAVTTFGLHLPGTGTGGGSQPPVTTVPVNSTVTYAGVDITVLNAQQAQSFVDDPKTGTDGMVRLNLQEQNKGSITVSRVYDNIARLILPGGTIVAPSYVKAPVGVAPGTTQTAFLDFAVPTTIKPGQLTFRLGATNEAQMDIPLTGKADLSKYQPKTVNPGTQVVYFGLNWTLVSATTQMSIPGQQALKGMRYIIVTLKVDNTLSQTAIPGSAYDYLRLQSGNIISSPKNTTLPVSFDAGVMGKTGTVSFLIPQASTDLTLVFEPQKDSGDKQVMAGFQIT